MQTTPSYDPTVLDTQPDDGWEAIEAMNDQQLAKALKDSRKRYCALRDVAASRETSPGIAGYRIAITVRPRNPQNDVIHCFVADEGGKPAVVATWEEASKEKEDLMNRLHDMLLKHMFVSVGDYQVRSEEVYSVFMDIQKFYEG